MERPQPPAPWTDPDVDRILRDAAGPHRDIPLARQVFVNRNLRLDKIDLVGFDMDYTLAVYQLQQMERLSLEMTAARMVERYGYPRDFLSIEYDPLFVIRGLVVDKPYGNIFKMDRHNHVGRCYRGRRALRFDDVKPLYRDEKIAPLLPPLPLDRHLLRPARGLPLRGGGRPCTTRAASPSTRRGSSRTSGRRSTRSTRTARSRRA